MAASKLKNRRRYITRDVRLDIPEDQEFTISPLDDVTSQQDFPYTFTANSSQYDRTWPRRSWRSANDFAKPFGPQQNHSTVVNSTLTLPRFHHGLNESQSTVVVRSGLQPQPPGDWHGSGNASPTTSPSSPDASFKTNCHDTGSLSSRNSNVSSPRDPATAFALGSIPEFDDDDRFTSGQETKRRSHSLNEGSSYRPFFNQIRTSRSPQPGSVLHRALTWEMAGKSQPFRVTVSPISDPKNQERGVRRNASDGKLHVILPQHVFDPSYVRSSGSAWRSVKPTTKSWTKQEDGQTINSNGTWKNSDSVSKPWTQQAGLAVNSTSAWKSTDPESKSWSKQEREAVIEHHRAIHLSPFTASLNGSRDELSRTPQQTTWNSISAGKQQSERCREMTCNGFDWGRLEQNDTGGSNNGFRDTDFKTTTRVSGVKASRSFSGSPRDRRETESSFLEPPIPFRDSHSDDMASFEDLLSVPLAKKSIDVDSYLRDNNNYTASCDSNSTSRKPYRSKSLKLLSSEANCFSLGRDTHFLRPLADWKTDTISQSTPTSPLTTPTELETGHKQQSLTHSLALPCLSMVALNTEPEELIHRPSSMTRSATSLILNTAPQKTLSTWGPFLVKDIRKAVGNSVASTPINGGLVKSDNVKPFGSNFVVRRITHLAKNPFNSISTIGEQKNGGIKPDQFLPTTTSCNETNSSFVKSVKAQQLKKENHTSQNQASSRSELKFCKQEPIEAAIAVNGHDLCVSDKVPWSRGSAWDVTRVTKLDEVCPPSNCDSLASSKDTGYGRSASESSPSVTSEHLTVHLAEPLDTSLVTDENRDRCNGNSILFTRNPERTNREPGTSRHIRVFLKSSTQLQDEACAVYEDNIATKAAAASASFDSEWTQDASKTKPDKNSSSNQCNETGNAMDAKAVKVKDSIKAKDSVKVKDSIKVTDSAITKISACLATDDSSAKATHSEYWPRKTSADRSPTLSESGGSCFKGQQKQNADTRPINLDTSRLSPERIPIAASSRCHIEMKSSNAEIKKPFEIVKKKLIIPEPMSWFGSKNEKLSKPSLKQDFTSQIEQDLLNRKNRCEHGFQSKEKQTEGVRLPSKEAAVKHKSVLHIDPVEHKISHAVEGGTENYVANGPSQTDFARLSEPPVQSKQNILENISIIPTDEAVIFDTGISIYEGITPNVDKTSNDNTFGERGEHDLEKSSSVFLEESLQYREPVDTLGFLDNWIDLIGGGKKCETSSPVNFLPDEKVSLANFTALSSLALEDKEAEEFQTSIDCSIMTELDQAIEMLTAARPLQNKVPTPDLHTSPKTTNGLMDHESSMAPWQNISRKLTQAFSDQANRKTPACGTKVPPPVQDKVRVTVSTALNNLEQKPAMSSSFFQSSCKPIAPIQVKHLSQNDVERKVSAAIDKRNQWLFLARDEDSFNRPDSPLFRKTLPLPKDSVIMRHRLHQKELGCSSSGGGTGSLSSSESSDDESPAQRVAPRRSKKSRSVSVDRGVTGLVERTEEEEDDRNEERDSIVSSTTSLRPLSLDSSFLSEDNM